MLGRLLGRLLDQKPPVEQPTNVPKRSNEVLQEQPKHLVIGCGHANPLCKNSHPKTQFLTMDIKAEIAPDIIADAGQVETVKEKLPDPKLLAIVYENLALEPLPLIDLLDEHGCFVSIGPDLFQIIKNLDEFVFDIESSVFNEIEDPKETKDQIIWTVQNSEKNKNVTIIPINPTDSNLALKFISDPILKAYLVQYLNEYNIEFCFKKLTITNELRARVRRFNAIEREDTLGSWFALGYLCSLDVLLRPRSNPISLEELKEIVGEYSPGFFRKHMTIAGETNGMTELKKAITDMEKSIATSADKTTLPIDGLLKILMIVLARRGRILNRDITSFNPTRDPQGSTSHVFADIAAAIINYFISDPLLTKQLCVHYNSLNQGQTYRYADLT